MRFDIEQKPSHRKRAVQLDSSHHTDTSLHKFIACINRCWVFTFSLKPCPVSAYFEISCCDNISPMFRLDAKRT